MSNCIPFVKHIASSTDSLRVVSQIENVFERGTTATTATPPTTAFHVKPELPSSFKRPYCVSFVFFGHGRHADYDAIKIAFAIKTVSRPRGVTSPPLEPLDFTALLSNFWNIHEAIANGSSL